jgi:hypothetical protein
MGRITTYLAAGLLAVSSSMGAAAPAGTQEQGDTVVAVGTAAAIADPKPAIVVDSTGAEVGPFVNTGGADSAWSRLGATTSRSK